MRVRNLVLSGIAAAAVIGGAAGTALADQDHAKPRPWKSGEPVPTSSPSEPVPTSRPSEPAPSPSEAAPRPPRPSPSSPQPAKPIQRRPSYTG